MNNVKPVILAGGLGSRLRPYTWVVPKPLLPIGERPIIQCQLMWLRSYGFKEVAIALGYRGDLIKAFVGDGKKYGIKIHYVQEDQRLGTAGPLALLKDWSEGKDLLSINGDLLTQLDLNKFIAWHREVGSSLTVATRMHEIKSPFGVIEVICGATVTKITEKPTIKQLVSAGVYLVSSEVVKSLKSNEHYDMTAVMTSLAGTGKVTSYLFEEPWTAVEHLGDFNTAINGEWIQWADSLEHRILQLTNTEG